MEDSDIEDSPQKNIKLKKIEKNINPFAAPTLEVSTILKLSPELV
jgi:hypothetical protein